MVLFEYQTIKKIVYYTLVNSKTIRALLYYVK